MPKRYPLEFKTQVVQACKRGLSISDASEKYRIAKSTLYRWIWEVHIPEGEKHAADYLTLQRQSARLGHLLQIIRLSNLIDETPLRKRLEILARLHEQFTQYSVHKLCEALDVSRGTFYNHIPQGGSHTVSGRAAAADAAGAADLWRQQAAVWRGENPGSAGRRRCPCWQRAHPENHERAGSCQRPGRCKTQLQKAAGVSKTEPTQTEF